MKIYDTYNRRTVAELMTNHGMCLDSALDIVADDLNREDGTVTIKGKHYDYDDLILVNNTYAVWLYDVWTEDGTPIVNDRLEVAEIAILDIADDDEITQALKDAGIITEDVKLNIEGDEHILYVETEDGTPVCEIVEKGF